MSNYGAPTNLDLSGCNVTATGGSTSQTLADLGKAVSDNATAIATANQTATTAQTTAAAANQTANETSAALTSEISNISNTYIPVSAYQQANGPAAYMSDGVTYAILPAAGNTNMPQVALGNIGTTQTVVVKIFAGGTGTDINNSIDACWLYRNGTSNYDGDVNLKAAALQPENDGVPALGGASNRWNGVYSNSGTIQTSDANEKTVVGVIGDINYIDSAKLIAAGKAIRKAVTVFTFNDGGTRKHVGAIAQNVASALTEAGLTPSDFGIWCQDALIETIEIKNADGVVTGYKQQPLLDSSGNQVYRQSLRYDELSMLLIAAGEAEAQDTSTNLASLTSRVAALEAKTTSTSTSTGSAS